MKTQALSGVAVVDKPRGLTSHTVVAQARRLFGRKDIGHAGTLDPMATGVLLVLVGQATKLSGYLTADSKQRAKPAAVAADFAGVVVPDRFVFGFGMDIGGSWRNLPSIRALAETTN